MLMMMVMPLLLITALPKMMQDPETKKEMEEMQAKMDVQNVPEIGDDPMVWCFTWFGASKDKTGGGASSSFITISLCIKHSPVMY